MSVWNCPACDNEIDDRIGRAALSLAVEQPVQFYSCNNCGNMYAPTAASLASALYASRESTNFSPSKSRIFRSLKKIVLRMRYGSRSKSLGVQRLVDVGCGNGDLANALVGIVPSIMAVDVPESRPDNLHDQIEYQCTTSFDLSGTKSQGATVFVLRHVLEHFENPVAQLQVLAKNAKSDDFFLIETPTKDSIFRFLMGSGWPGYFPPFHVTVLTEKSLCQVAKRAGLEVVEVKKCEPPILGTYLTQKTKALPNVMRSIGVILYPAQLLLSKMSGRSEAIEILMKKP